MLQKCRKTDRHQHYIELVEMFHSILLKLFMFNGACNWLAQTYIIGTSDSLNPLIKKYYISYAF